MGAGSKPLKLFGKLANIGDDIGDEFISDASVLRKLTTGERINVERKGQDPFEFFNYAALLFSANAVPRIRDKTGAIQRRLVIVPFDATFTPDDPGYNSTLRYDLSQQKHTEYLIVLALAGLKRALANQRFTEPQRVKAANKEYEDFQKLSCNACIEPECVNSRNGNYVKGCSDANGLNIADNKRARLHALPFLRVFPLYAFMLCV